MNAEKLAKLQAQVRIGGKGSQRRKKKVVHRSSATDDKKLQNSLKKLTVNNISGIEEVNMIKDDGTVIHFNNPKVQASLNANTFAVSGHAENKQITEMLPGILSHLGAEGFNQLKRLASSVNPALFSGAVSAAGIDEDDDDVPELVEDFEAASKTETAAEKPSEPKKEEPKITELSNITADVPKIVEITEEPKVEETKAPEPEKTEEAVTEEPAKTEEAAPAADPVVEAVPAVEPVVEAAPTPAAEPVAEVAPVPAAEPVVAAPAPEPVKVEEPVKTEEVKAQEPEPVKTAEAPVAPSAEE